ncbi:EI24 domain-containing protein [Nocardiopsis chromatogenes]|uniref:EI24 domain-containing protein n=1 Tax=Nocardiopsis chromatogenes TaxID=280239 RepID=UPI00034DF5D5|nr:EI24 domain-containing protein [Nocardiopsis chromatogenes]
MTTAVRDVFSGAGLLLRGAGIVLSRPKLFFLGAIPPLFTSLLFLGALIALLYNIADLAAWATPFAEAWAGGWRNTVRITAGVLMVGAAVLVMVVGFTGLTLALGSPLYDLIAEDVEERMGGAPEADESLTGSIARSVRQSLVLVLISALIALPLLIAGFVPVVGQTVVPVVSALFGGFMLGMELVGAAFDRRGLRRLGDRRRAIWSRKALSLGFAVPAYFLLAIPFVAVLVFPAATAGGTLLARRILPAAPPVAPPAGPVQGYPQGGRWHPPQGGHPPQQWQPPYGPGQPR